MDVLSGIFSAFGLSASAGLNAYIPLLVVSLLGRYTSVIQLNAPWDTLTNGWIIGLLVALSAIEFFADKTPLVNHLNDAIQTFIRPAAGAIAFAASTQVIDGINPVMALAAGLLVAGTVHVAKAGVMRPAVTGVSGGTANVAVGLVEDVAAISMSLVAVLIPVIIGIVFIPVLALVIWLVVRRASRNTATQTN
ncbi:MAG: DUF4126 domain-containing protein [Anaerolineales bacterium]|nr:DUF4126 domain-containing protein [Anaerolineales bacterium]MCW5838492.1 DUF4126 domain-containing protein [Anaerolineales bacterium]